MKTNTHKEVAISGAFAVAILTGGTFMGTSLSGGGIPLSAELGKSCSTYTDCSYGYVCEAQVDEDGNSTGGACVLPGRRLTNIMRNTTGERRVTKRILSTDLTQDRYSARRLLQIQSLGRSTAETSQVSDDVIRKSVRKSDTPIVSKAYQRRLSRMLKASSSGSVAATAKRSTERLADKTIVRRNWVQRYGTRYKEAMTGSSSLLPYESDAAYRRRLRLLKRQLSDMERLSQSDEEIRPVLQSATSR